MAEAGPYVVKITRDGKTIYFFAENEESEKLTSWLEVPQSTHVEMINKLKKLQDIFKIGEPEPLAEMLKGIDACNPSVGVSDIADKMWHVDVMRKYNFENFVDYDKYHDMPANARLVSIDIRCHAPAASAAPAASVASAASAASAAPADVWIQGVNQVLSQMPMEPAGQMPPAAPEESYRILKLVAVSITHGASVAESTCREIPYATHDFRDVFFFGDVGESIRFDDAKYKELFAKRFSPTEDTMKTLLGKDRPRCTYENPNVYLPPIVFTIEPSHDTIFKMTEYKIRLKHLMGLYLYIIRENPDKTKLYIQKLKIASYDELDPGIYMTYSIIFDKFHRYIKANDELRQFMQSASQPLTVGFFCCRGENMQQKKLNIASIQTPYALLPPIIYDSTRDVISPCMIPCPRLYLHRMVHTYTFAHLHSIIMQGQPLFMREERSMNWQSCLYNLFTFFNIITRESANALASVSSFQQIRQISNGVFLVSGESTQEAIRILNGLIPESINRLFIVQRSPIPLGIFKIITVLSQLPVNQVYVMFTKMYRNEFVPTADRVPSQIGHWIAIVRFANNDLYYIDVQSSLYIPLQGDVHSVYHQLGVLITSQQYAVMDLLYLSTATITPYCDGPDVFNLQLPPPPPPPHPGGGMRRRRHMSKKRKCKSKTKTRTKKIA